MGGREPDLPADRQLSKFPCLRFYFRGCDYVRLLRSCFFVFTGLPSSQISVLLSVSLSDLAEQREAAWNENDEHTHNRQVKLGPMAWDDMR